jgi:hypothetical protein
LALIYGRLPIYEMIKEIVVEDRVFHIAKSTYRIDRGDIGKTEVHISDKKSIREDRARKRINDIRLQTTIANIIADNNRRKRHEKKDNGRKKNHEQGLERPAIELRMPYGYPGESD